MKECPKCGTNQPISEYHKHQRGKDGLYRICKNCCREKDKKYYKKNKHLYTESNKKLLNRNKSFILRWKKIFGKCIDCGTTDWRVLEFDHIKDKFSNVSDLQHYSIKKIKEEIRKCECRCANCHRIKTMERREINV